MVLLIQYISIYAPWIYALCGLVALYHIYRTWQVRSERRQALFSLEREKAMRDLMNILMVCLMLLVVMGVTYFSSEVLADAIEIEETIRPPATATPIVFAPPSTATPEPTPTEVVEVITDTVTAEQVAPVVEPAPAIQEPEPAPAEPEPDVAPPIVASVCPDPRVQLTSPSSGLTVSGQVPILGTATHEQFQYYKLEYAPGANAEGGYLYLSGGSSAATGTIGALDSTSLTNGTWTIRLVVVDQTGNFPPPCAVTVNIQN